MGETMEEVSIDTLETTNNLSPDVFEFARNYQVEARDKAIKQNTIVFLETGSGKTLIAIMLLRNYAYLLRKPSKSIAVFLVPTVVLVQQQAKALERYLDLSIGKYWGEMGVDFWDGSVWKQECLKHEVLVMTPMILLNALRHSFIKLEAMKVLIFDECHNARGKHAYACIMKEFYHPSLQAGVTCLPRIFGMTASPVKGKGSSSSAEYWKEIRELEDLMNSKVHTVVSESVLAEYIPFSNTKMKFFKDAEIPISLSSSVTSQLNSLEDKYKSAIEKSDLSKTTSESTKKKMSKLFSTYIYCFEELGLWLALKAAESISREESEQFSCTKSDVCGEKFMRDLSLEACKLFSSHLPSGQSWSISDDINANVDAGYLTYKVICLLESLLEYRDKKEFRCIIFVDRVVTAIVLPLLLNDVLPKLCSWHTKYTAGHQSRLQSQSRTEQHKVVEDFRSGAINIIVATSILEEGLDVQSCNVVIRFDLSSTVCSFIQSRGRARVQGSDFVLMMRNGDKSSHTRMENYLKSGEVMREESILHASVPCGPLKSQDEPVMYRVESTGAIVTLTSSVVLLYFYCSRLPSDGYFKPAPYFQFDDDLGTCTLYLPKSSSLTNHVTVSGNGKFLKKMACLEACKQLHQIGALTDHLLPDMVVEQEAVIQELGNLLPW